MTLTAERLREVLAYDQLTGLFTNRISRPQAPAGRAAGCIRHDGYTVIRIDYQLYLAHRLAWLYVHGRWPGIDVDHCNGDTSDNRLGNLRLATASQNGGNSARSKNNTSGFKGVTWSRKKRLWRAQITVDRRNRHLGYFHTAKAAHAAYSAAAVASFAAFARAA